MTQPPKTKRTVKEEQWYAILGTRTTGIISVHLTREDAKQEKRELGQIFSKCPIAKCTITCTLPTTLKVKKK